MSTVRTRGPAVSQLCMSAFVAASWAAGCSGPSAPSNPPPAAATAPGPDVPGVTFAAERPDLDRVLAGLKDTGLAVASSKDVQVWSFRYSGPPVALSVWVEIDEVPKAGPDDAPRRIDLPPSGAGAGSGVIQMVIVPPAATGREGARIILQDVPEATGRARTVSRDVSPLWFDWGGRPMAQSVPAKGAFKLGPAGRGLKIVALSARDRTSSAYCNVNLRCKAGLTPGGRATGPTTAVGASPHASAPR
jgi:hypothetical protein